MLKIDAPKDNPALKGTLNFLEADIAAHPDHLRPVDAEFVEWIAALVDGVTVDLDQPLADDED